ncbi:conserved hypothetical protein [Thermobifida fusca YX]|nr:conserved hypothetical protein [Thermobifida fusca YX]
MRGEHPARGWADIGYSGPSPRAWGAFDVNKTSPRQFRSIPTCVGSIQRPAGLPSREPVHPHVRGEHAFPGGPGDAAGGPSPRAWGASHRERFGEPRTGSIPTCVGSICCEERPEHAAP